MMLLHFPAETCVPRQPVSAAVMQQCFGDGDATKVLVWTRVGFRSPFDPHWNWTIGEPVSGCDRSTPCVWSADEECLHAADAVVIADWVARNVPARLEPPSQGPSLEWRLIAVCVSPCRICGQKYILLQFEAPILANAFLPKLHLNSYFDAVSTYK